MVHNIKDSESAVAKDFIERKEYLLNSLREEYNKNHWPPLCDPLSLKFTKFYLSITSKIESGVINDETILSYHNHCIFNTKSEEITELLKRSCALNNLAEIAYETKETEKAWSLLTEAFFYYGMSKSPIGLLLYEAKKRTEIAKSGGDKLAANINSVKEEALRLLNNAWPTDGWHKKQDAIKTIRQDVLTFIKSNNISGITASNIENWLSKKLPPAKQLKKPKPSNQEQ